MANSKYRTEIKYVKSKQKKKKKANANLGKL